jgi:hypothetical protein
MTALPLEVGWVQTASGGRFYPLKPRVEDVNIKDIAAALSKNCRFTGHCSQFYSVAEHSLLVAGLLRSKTDDPEVWMWGLLHDAPEAYIADIARPLKQQPEFKFYRDMEAKITEAICTRFGLAHKEPSIVKGCDTMALAIEARDLMPKREKSTWAWMPEPRADKSIVGMDPDTAEENFMLEYNLLESLRV